MRTPQEIQRAIDQLKDALSGMYPLNPDEMMHISAVTSGTIKALVWVLGSDEAGGFADMLKDLDAISEPRKPS